MELVVPRTDTGLREYEWSKDLGSSSRVVLPVVGGDRAFFLSRETLKSPSHLVSSDGGSLQERHTHVDRRGIETNFNSRETSPTDGLGLRLVVCVFESRLELSSPAVIQNKVQSTSINLQLVLSFLGIEVCHSYGTQVGDRSV